MDDDARALRDHRRQQCPVEADGRHQIEVQLLRPLPIVENGKAAARRGGAAQHIDENIDTAKSLERGGGDDGAALRRGDVGRDVTDALGRIVRH